MEARRLATAAEARANNLSSAFAASEREREAQGAELRQALQRTEGELANLARELTETRQAVGLAEARNATLADEVRASRDRSSELARELTSVIADRGRLTRYSAVELQLAALRRLWPFR
jgi:predicted nuclease with TOPRIM domain